MPITRSVDQVDEKGRETLTCGTADFPMNLTESVLAIGISERTSPNVLEVIEMPSAELSRGRGGPRCMSMPLWRED